MDHSGCCQGGGVRRFARMTTNATRTPRSGNGPPALDVARAVGAVRVSGKQIAKPDAQIQEQLRAYEEALALRTPNPEVEEVTAAHLIAEIGVNIDSFPSARHLASGAGMCPGWYIRQPSIRVWTI
jgi:hypothetical protein